MTVRRRHSTEFAAQFGFLLRGSAESEQIQSPLDLPRQDEMNNWGAENGSSLLIGHSVVGGFLNTAADMINLRRD